jgi:hypothetical protein
MGSETYRIAFLERQLAPARPAAFGVSAAADFVAKAWERRPINMRVEGMGTLGACKFASLFAVGVFGGKMQGNFHHQWAVTPDHGVVDLTCFGPLWTPAARRLEAVKLVKRYSEAVGYQIVSDDPERLVYGNGWFNHPPVTPDGLFTHDEKFWGNKDHASDLESCMDTVMKWLTEFDPSRWH